MSESGSTDTGGSVLARFTLLRVSGSRGVGVLEYVAALSLASIIIASVVGSLTDTHLDDVTAQAICTYRTALSVGSCSPGADTPPGPGPTPAPGPTLDPKPKKCKVTEHAEKLTSQVTILFIKIGTNSGFIETTYSDGTVSYTATDGIELGVTGGVGVELDIGKLEGGARVDFGAGVKFDYGSTWTFGNAEEAAALRKELDAYVRQQDNISQNPYMALPSLWGGLKKAPRPPDQLVSTIEVTADTEAKVGLNLPWDSKPKDPPATKDDDESKVPGLELAEAGLKFGGSGKWTQIKDTASGATTYTTGGEVFGQAGATAGPVGGELKGILGSSMAITRDKDNNITKVALVTTREGKLTGTVGAGQAGLGGKVDDADSVSTATVTTASLEVTTPEQRALVDGWLAGQSGDAQGLTSPQTYYPDKLVPGDAFQNLMFTNATVSNVQYRNVTDKTGFAFEVKLGVAFGIDISHETSDSTAVDATYLDIPGPDGIRAPVDFPECEA